MTINRRQFLGYMGAGAAMTALPVLRARAANPHVVVVGGGFGGATCTKYLRRYDNAINITLIEPNAQYITCPGSNWVLGGLREMDRLTQNYTGLKAHNVKHVAARVERIDAAKRRVRLDNGDDLSYDRLVVAPGIDFIWGSIEGYDAQAAEQIPHAYKAGAQTTLLRKQLLDMPDGGTVLISVPGDPFRCPPGPYERVSMIAHYLKTHKPKSKILVLDVKDKFSKQGLFQAAWQELYPGMIEWVPGSAGGKVERIDVAKRTVYTQEGLESHHGDVINLICPHRAGTLAQDAGLADASGWCPIDQKTFESTAAAEDPRHRRRLHRRRHAQVRPFGQQSGQDVRRRDRRPAERTGGADPLARQYLLQPGRAELWHLRRCGLSPQGWRYHGGRRLRRREPRRCERPVPPARSTLCRRLVYEYHRGQFRLIGLRRGGEK